MRANREIFESPEFSPKERALLRRFKVPEPSKEFEERMLLQLCSSSREERNEWSSRILNRHRKTTRHWSWGMVAGVAVVVLLFFLPLLLRSFRMSSMLNSQWNGIAGIAVEHFFGKSSEDSLIGFPKHINKMSSSGRNKQAYIHSVAVEPATRKKMGREKLRHINQISSFDRNKVEHSRRKYAKSSIYKSVVSRKPASRQTLRSAKAKVEARLLKARQLRSRSKLICVGSVPDTKSFLNNAKYEIEMTKLDLIPSSDNKAKPMVDWSIFWNTEVCTYESELQQKLEAYFVAKTNRDRDYHSTTVGFHCRECVDAFGSSCSKG